MTKITFKGTLDLSNEVWKQKKKEIREYRNCAVCNARLIMLLCHYYEEKYYCEEYCPVHEWQSDHSWVIECAKCGLPYIKYLENLLEKNNTRFLKY